jgi:hypothetical protein
MPELRRHRRLLLLLLLWAAAAGPAMAQQLQLLQSLPMQQPQAISIDRLGQVYVADLKNNLHKYSPRGELLFTFSPPTPGRLTSLEAWNPVKTLLFYQDRQQLLFLDRFLTPLSTIRLSDLSDGLVRLATLAQDDQLWVLNESDFSLQKIDPRYPDARLQTSLNQLLNADTYDFRLLREYQNNLYLLDANSGIYLFDNMGNFKKKLPVRGITSLGFQGEEGYYLKNGQLTFFHLYTLRERTVALPPVRPYQQVLVGNKTVYLFSPTHLDIYLLNQ